MGLLNRAKVIKNPSPSPFSSIINLFKPKNPAAVKSSVTQHQITNTTVAPVVVDKSVDSVAATKTYSPGEESLEKGILGVNSLSPWEEKYMSGSEKKEVEEKLQMIARGEVVEPSVSTGLSWLVLPAIGLVLYFIFRK